MVMMQFGQTGRRGEVAWSPDSLGVDASWQGKHRLHGGDLAKRDKRPKNEDGMHREPRASCLPFEDGREDWSCSGVRKERPRGDDSDEGRRVVTRELLRQRETEKRRRVDWFLTWLILEGLVRLTWAARQHQDRGGPVPRQPQICWQ